MNQLFIGRFLYARVVLSHLIKTSSIKCIFPFYRWGSWGSEKLNAWHYFGFQNAWNKTPLILSPKLLIHTSFQMSDSRNFSVLCPSSVAGIQKSRKHLWCSVTHTFLCGIYVYFHCHYSKLHLHSSCGCNLKSPSASLPWWWPRSLDR